MTVLIAALLTASAHAYSVAAIDCCHVPAPTAAAADPMVVVIVPPADGRLSVASSVDEATRAGVVRGGWGNPFRLGAERPVRDEVGEVLADQLRALGHDVHLDTGAAPAIGSPALDDAALEGLVGAGVDLVLHGVLTEWEVDIGAYGSYKLVATLDVAAVGPAVQGRWQTSVALDEKQGEGFTMSFDRGLGGLKSRAEEWYGKKGAKYVNTAAYETGLIELAAALVYPGTPGHDLFVTGSASAPEAPAAAPGCGMDTDCKGDRICVEGACVDP